MEEFAKIKDENDELEHKLWDSQASLQALVNNHTTVTGKVSSLEARAKAVEERVAQEEFIRDAAIQEPVEQALEEFKQFEEYAAIMTTQYDTGDDTGFNKSSSTYGGSIEMSNIGSWGKILGSLWRGG